MSVLFRLKILSRKKVLADEDIFQVTLPGLGGEVTILGGHDIFVCALKAGKIWYKKKEDDKEEDFIEISISGGCAEITHKSVTVFVD